MPSQAKKKLTPEEYLAWERAAPGKSEYLDGEVFAMAGASRRHALIVTNVAAELRNGLKAGDCEAYSTDLRLRVTSTGLYTYADVMVVCGEAEFTDDHIDTVTNPILIVEVLSKSTQDYDRGGKFAHYRTLPSLMHYLLVAQDRCHVEHFFREAENRWVLSESDRMDGAVRFSAIDFELKISEIYHKVKLDA